MNANPSIAMTAKHVSVNALTAFTLQHSGSTALLVNAAGTTLTDDSIVAKGSKSVEITAGTSFALKFGSLASKSPVLSVDSQGTKIRDDVIGITGKSIIFIEGGNLGTHFVDGVTMYKGVKVTGGAVDVGSQTTSIGE